jgi:ABC-2 type transport system ATP-binding protein
LTIPEKCGKHVNFLKKCLHISLTPDLSRAYSRVVAALRASRIVKRYAEIVAVNGVDLTVEPGEVRGLLGPNGAGKSTLLRMLLGLVKPDGGSIELLGHPLEDAATTALDGVGGFVEEPAFYPYLTGRVNLSLLARLDGEPWAGEREDARNAVDSALERVGLEHRGDDRVGGYSTGMRQRLGIAAALLRSPKLLLLDEPTSGLDPAGARAISTLVRELAADGVAILLSSHQIGELERVCTTYTFLREGQVAWDGTAEELEAQAPMSAFSLVTNDDAAAFALAGQHDGVRAQLSARGGISLTARPEGIDAYMLALGDARIVIRRLELRVSPLESMFFAVNIDEGAVEQLEPEEYAAKVLASA